MRPYDQSGNRIEGERFAVERRGIGEGTERGGERVRPAEQRWCQSAQISRPYP
jgi:hypothetical protein